MSDSRQGPGWWQASDGKWYAPEQRPGGSTPLPPPAARHSPTPPPTPPPAMTPFGFPGGPLKRKPWWRRWWALTTAAVVALAIVAGFVGDGDEPGGESDSTTGWFTGSVAPDESLDVTIDTVTGGADDDDIDDVDQSRATQPALPTETTPDTQPAVSTETTPDTQPAVPSFGTLDNPVPVGQPTGIVLDAFGDGDGSTWTLTVTGPGTDFTQVVADENQFNEPPPEGSIYYAVPVSLRLDRADKEPLSTLFNVELEYYGPISRSIIDPGLDEGCGVTPGEIDPFKEVFAGGTLTGVVCLTVAVEDVAAGVLLTTDSVQGDRVFFATTGEPIEITSGDDPANDGNDSPRLAPGDGEPGGRSNPYPIGDAVMLEVASLGDGDGSVWTLTVLGPGTDLTQVIADENQFNEPPPDGSVFYGVPVSLTLERAGKQPLSLLFNLELEYYGPATLSIIDAGFDVGCGVTPDELDVFTEVFVGGTVAGTLCLAVTRDDVAAGPLLTTDSIADGRVYFATS